MKELYNLKQEMAKQEGKVIRQKLLLVTHFCHFPETETEWKHKYACKFINQENL